MRLGEKLDMMGAKQISDSVSVTPKGYIAPGIVKQLKTFIVLLCNSSSYYTLMAIIRNSIRNYAQDLVGYYVKI